MTLTFSQTLEIQPDDFDPPLNRKQAAVPGYWTVEELAEELGVTVRYIQYLIKGKPKENKPPQINAYKAGFTYLVADIDALEYIKKARHMKK
jgi:transcriptional regulator with XRE-family HTH domain